MNSRDVVGRRIVRVEQTRVETNSGWSWNLDALVLDNGTRIGFSVQETPEGAEYVVSATVYKHPKHPKVNP